MATLSFRHGLSCDIGGMWLISVFARYYDVHNDVLRFREGWVRLIIPELVRPCFACHERIKDLSFWNSMKLKIADKTDFAHSASYIQLKISKTTKHLALVYKY